MKTPYFPLYANDDLADTGWLSLEEYGAYTRLRCHAWKDEIAGTLPDDDEVIAKKLGIDLAKWQEMKPTILGLFKLGSDGRWHHTGLRQAFEKARQKSKSGQSNAKKRWEQEKAGKPGAGGMPSHSEANATALQPLSMSEVRSQSQNQREEGDPLSPAETVEDDTPTLVDSLSSLLCKLYQVGGRAGWKVADQFRSLAVELAGLNATGEQVSAFWSERRKKPAINFFAGDFTTWRATHRAATSPSVASTPKQSGADVPDWYKEIYQP